MTFYPLINRKSFQIYLGISRSPTCSLTCSVTAYKNSSLRASSPWLEPGETTCLGEAMAFRTVFRQKSRSKQIERPDPPLVKSCVSGVDPGKAPGPIPTNAPCDLVCSATLRIPVAPLRTIAQEAPSSSRPVAFVGVFVADTLAGRDISRTLCRAPRK